MEAFDPEQIFADQKQVSNLKRNKVDPDHKNGGRELLVISITVKDRIIEATVRQNTDLEKLYERISLLGDFTSYPHKFKDIFMRYWKGLITDAQNLLKEEEKARKLGNKSSRKFDDNSSKIHSISKTDNSTEKPKPIIHITKEYSDSNNTTSNFQDHDKARGNTRTQSQ